MSPSYSIPAVEDLLFIDIETVSRTESYEMLSVDWQTLWKKKAFNLGFKEEGEVAQLFKDKAAIYSEFGRVVAFSLGYCKDRIFYAKDYTSYTEKELLINLCNLLPPFFKRNMRFCGHNCKEFDLPYIARRLLVHNLPIPNCLDNRGKKPWEVNTVDTMELWRMGDRKNFTSLQLLASLFSLPSSKDQMDGSDVHHYFYEKKDLKSIGNYCKKDVVLTAQIFCKMTVTPLFDKVIMH